MWQCGEVVGQVEWAERHDGGGIGYVDRVVRGRVGRDCALRGWMVWWCGGVGVQCGSVVVMGAAEMEEEAMEAGLAVGRVAAASEVSMEEAGEVDQKVEAAKAEAMEVELMEAGLEVA